jgi:hypothetical protein
MKMIDRLTVKVEPLWEFMPASKGVLRLRFRVDGDGESIGYDQIIDQNDLTKSVFDHMWESAKMKIEEAFVKRPDEAGGRG